jgi:hypothetical protein
MGNERVVLYSGMELGHLVPMTELTELFHLHGFSVTVVSADPPNKTRSASNLISKLCKQNQLISFHNLPAVVQQDPNRHPMDLMFDPIALNCNVIFSPSSVIFQDRVTGRTIGEGSLERGLYIVKRQKRVFNSIKENLNNLWHCRMAVWAIRLIEF